MIEDLLTTTSIITVANTLCRSYSGGRLTRVGRSVPPRLRRCYGFFTSRRQMRYNGPGLNLGSRYV
jgi:hypothetical protein